MKLPLYWTKTEIELDQNWTITVQQWTTTGLKMDQN